jgi:hypothetical protein
MTRNTQPFVRYGIVVFSLMTAIAVYLFARIYPPEILAPFQLSDPDLARHIAIFGSAPSFFYTLALGLLIGACAPTVTGARVHCLAWIGLALCLELSQYQGIAKPITAWLYNISSESIWEFVGPYWSRGVFDPLDLLATLIGGTIALILLGYLPKENIDANNS